MGNTHRQGKKREGGVVGLDMDRPASGQICLISNKSKAAAAKIRLWQCVKAALCYYL